jgi:hypothetical protein
VSTFRGSARVTSVQTKSDNESQDDCDGKR